MTEWTNTKKHSSARITFSQVLCLKFLRLHAIYALFLFFSSCKCSTWPTRWHGGMAAQCRLYWTKTQLLSQERDSCRPIPKRKEPTVQMVVSKRNVTGQLCCFKKERHRIAVWKRNATTWLCLKKEHHWTAVFLKTECHYTAVFQKVMSLHSCVLKRSITGQLCFKKEHHWTAVFQKVMSLHSCVSKRSVTGQLCFKKEHHQTAVF